MISSKVKKPQVLVMVGTRKGGFIFTSDQERMHWQMSEIKFKSWNVMHMTYDERHHRLHAAVVHDVYGPSTHYSDDFGETWSQASEVPTFCRPSKSGRPVGTPQEISDEKSNQDKPEKVLKVWNITPGRINEPGVLYAGVEPAALFHSTDNGETWKLVESLFDHPHRSKWFPGAGGLCLHTILLDPSNPNRIYVAISAGGCYRSDDGGKTWQPKNKNVRADFLAETSPEFGQCVHKMTLHPQKPNVLYQQNHCGVYRSDDYGDSWIDIGEGHLPSRFGFPVIVHPHNPDMIYVILEESDEFRLSIGGQPAVWRTDDRGNSWKRFSQGLPKDAYLVVLRQAMAADQLPDSGIYFGTSTGQVFYSLDDGENWQLLADFLPSILSIDVAII